ncbi:MAG: YidC/Oxa1 family membrane protein insertase [Chloroflexota bacterium]|nr:YidC/Oxa1 family membrane protein insertase [Chloroflexota bacterium]
MPIWNEFVHLIGAGLTVLYHLTGNGGIAIVLFTILVRLALLPLSLPALRNSRKQQELQPLIREIQKKHKGDRAAATAEQMELYRQYGFNPMAGCLPTLVQLPFFFALWRAIYQLARTDAGQSGFLWLPHISHPDPIHLLPILAAAMQFLQTRMSMQPKSQVVDPQQRQMNSMMQFMPLMVIMFGWNIASGAVLYWFVSSLFSAVQQWFVTGWGSLYELLPFLPHREPRRYLGDPRPAGHAQGKPGLLHRFQEKMLEAQQQQQSQQTQRQGIKASKPVEAEAASTAPPPEEVAVEIPRDDGHDVRHTEDAWRLPGAPGSTGIKAGTVLTAPKSAPTNTSQTRNGQQRSNNRKRRRK